MSAEDDDIRMHRRADTPDGKLTAKLDVQISEDLNESLIALAKLRGFSNRSEYVRDLLHRCVYGEMDALRLKIRAISGNGGNNV